MASRRARSRVEDRDGNLAVLFRSRWDLDFAVDEFPDIDFSAVGGRISPRRELAST
jgi:peptide subunit release factor RF-3